MGSLQETYFLCNIAPKVAWVLSLSGEASEWWWWWWFAAHPDTCMMTLGEMSASFIVYFYPSVCSSVLSVFVSACFVCEGLVWLGEWRVTSNVKCASLSVVTENYK